jgi:uncharacterized repeat protein (TIGR03943 family)
VGAVVRRDAAAVVLVALAALGLRLGFTDALLDYVQPWMRWPIVATAVLLAVLGVSELVDSVSGRQSASTGPADGCPAPGQEAGHGGHSTRVAWLLAAPVVVTLVVAPGALEADAVFRALPAAPIPLDELAPLPTPIDGWYELPVAEFVARSVGPEGGLEGLPVKLVGFVVDRGEDSSLARFRISCCAADAQVSEVRLRGVDAVPAENSWIVVYGRWVPGGPTGGAVMDVERLIPVARPANPYE